MGELLPKYDASTPHLIRGDHLNELIRRVQALEAAVRDSARPTGDGGRVALVRNETGAPLNYGDVVELGDVLLTVDDANNTNWRIRPCFEARLPDADHHWRDDRIFGIMLSACDADDMASAVISGHACARVDMTYSEAGAFAEVVPGSPVLRRQAAGRFRILGLLGELGDDTWATIDLEIGNYTEVVEITDDPVAVAGLGTAWPAKVIRWVDDAEEWQDAFTCYLFGLGT